MKRASARRLTEAELAEARRLIAAGNTLREAARRLDVTDHRLMRIAKNAKRRRDRIATGLRRRLQVAAYLGLPVNFQMELFSAPASDDALARAHSAGLDAGIEGRDPKPPEQFQSGDLSPRWMEGWHAGQARLREAMEARMTAQNAATAAEPKKRGRPPGSKNKPKEPAEIVKAEDVRQDAAGDADPFEDEDEADLRPRHLRQPDAGTPTA